MRIQNTIQRADPNVRDVLINVVNKMREKSVIQFVNVQRVGEREGITFVLPT